jgi:hypothetical protein
VPFYKELGNAGLKAKDVPVVAFSVGEEELRGVDTKPLVGHLAAWNYFMSIKNPANEFIKKWSAYAKALAWGDKRLGALFSGISLGSILLLVALGLAITYGLMGVINMAHGELMMIGAYATYVVQGLFQKFLPGAFDWYLLAAVPVAFMASALVGAALERSVIRFLYGRPLETLLATWGISLMLMQGAQPVRRAERGGGEPAWMSGGVQVLPNLTAALQPPRHHRLCRCRAVGHGAA